MKEYIIGYILKGCPYSMLADEILKKNSNNQLIYVDYSEKDKYKKMNHMSTFPQIFYIKDGLKIKIGGYDDLSSLMDRNKLENRKELYKNCDAKISYRTFLKMLLYLNR